ncbi:TPA: hypothetical protein F8R96_09045 [Legionella pneumophila]|nr:hypothetical protein [Legionella pneumophila]
MDKDYIRSSRYPGAVQAEGCISIVAKPCLARNIKFHTRLRDCINASSARTIGDNALSYP